MRSKTTSSYPVGVPTVTYFYGISLLNIDEILAARLQYEGRNF